MTTTTISDFRAHTQKHVDRARRTGKPEVVTLRGKPQGVWMSPQAYDEIARLAEHAKVAAMIQEGAAQMDAGLGIEVTPEYWADFRSEMRARIKADKKGR